MMDWAEGQSIVGVIYGGIQKAGTALNIPFDDLMEWVDYAQDIENHNKLMNKQCVEVVKEYKEAGFDCMVLKGQGNATMYPHPLLRMPGDIDLLVLGHTDITDSTDRETNTFASQGHTLKERTPHSQRENLTNDTNRKTNTNCTNDTNRLIASREKKEKSDSKLIREVIRYVRTKNPEGKAQYHHIDLGEIDGVEVEVHYKASYVYNPFANRRLQKWFKSYSDTADLIELPKGVGRIPVPTWEFNVVFQLCHIYNHLIHEGIGIRQMVDYYYLLKANKELEEVRGSYRSAQEVKRQYHETLRKLGLMEIAGAVMWVLGYLVYGEQFRDHGCRREEWMICEPDERRGRFLLDEIMEGGNFGMGLKPDAGWLGADTAIGRNILRLKRDARLLRYFPSECLWEPVFRLWHFGWRLAH